MLISCKVNCYAVRRRHNYQVPGHDDVIFAHDKVTSQGWSQVVSHRMSTTNIELICTDHDNAYYQEFIINS